MRSIGNGMAVSQRMKLLILSLLFLAVLLAQTPIGIGWAVESTLTIQPSIADTFVNSMYLTTKYSEDPHGYLWAIFAGNMYVEYDSFKGYGSSRIYIKFNITSIPKDAKILSANMCLYMYDPPKTSQEFEAYRVLSDWDQDKLTWRTQPPSTKTSTSTTTINPTPTEAWVCWEIISDLKMWHSKAAENYGTMIKIKHETNASDQVASFLPKEALRHQELRPKLLVRVDWHEPITPTPSPTHPPTETPTYTPPSPPPATTTPPTTINPPTPTPRPETPTFSPLVPVTIIGLITLASGLFLISRKRARNTHSKKNRSSGVPKRLVSNIGFTSMKQE